MTHSPPISPKVATPLAHRKRRFSAVDKPGPVVVHLTASDGEIHVAPSKREHKAESTANGKVSKSEAQNTTNGKRGMEEFRRLEDDEFEDEDEDDKSLLEDMLDTAELEPYDLDDSDDDEGLSAKMISRLHAKLRSLGPEGFLQETIERMHIPPVLLGTAFGINPAVREDYGHDFYMRLLGAAIVRTYHKRQKLPQYNTIDDAAALLSERKKIMVITGAGISTSLGIPDFRSKQTGFYTKLLELSFHEPEQVFDIEQFDEDPKIFYELAADLLPDLKRYSPTHAFIRLLQDKAKLQTNYTQNIDNLEELAGIEKDRLIQCHGSFATATCRKCKHKVKGTEIYPDMRAKRVAHCKRCIATLAASAVAPQKSKKRKTAPSGHWYSSDSDEDDNIPTPGVMKPDITFFGEKLPDNFFDRFTQHDAKNVDLVIVIGTSLKVAPVSEMPNFLPKEVPHVYISREACEHVNFDVQLLGTCDDVVWELCRRAGWELRHEMIPKDHEVKVEPVEGSGHRWRVVRAGGGTGKGTASGSG